MSNIDLKSKYLIKIFIHLIVFFSCFSIPSISNLMNNYDQVLIIISTLLLILFFFIEMINLIHSNYPSMFVLLAILWLLVIAYLTLSKGGNFNNCYSTIIKMLVPIIWIDILRKNKEIKNLIDVWIKVLSLLGIIDVITMLIYPTGMYTTLYTGNWFLGYKTERLPFYLLLIVLLSIQDKLERKPIRKKTYFYIVLSFFALVYSKGTAALYSILLLAIMIIILDKKVMAKLIKFLLNSKIMLLLYSTLSYLTFSISSSNFMQNFVVHVLHKDITLTTRITIWRNLFNLIRINNYKGYGWLVAKDYEYLTNNIYATNAHNMVLSIVITSGIAGLLIYIFMFVRAMDYNDNNICSFIIKSGVLSVLICGITSSILVFSPVSFVLLSILTIDFSKLGNEIENIIY